MARVPALRAGDLLLFTDWRGDPGELLAPAGPTVAAYSARRPAELPAAGRRNAGQARPGSGRMDFLPADE